MARILLVCMVARDGPAPHTEVGVERRRMRPPGCRRTAGPGGDVGTPSASMSHGRGVLAWRRSRRTGSRGAGWAERGGMATQRDTELTDEQVVQLRDDVAAGRRPRVRVSGPQFPSGTIGTVLAVGDPSADGGDFITVRVKIAGVTDELGFSPRELSMVGRGRAAAPAASPSRKRTPSSPRARRSEGSPVAPAAKASGRSGTSRSGVSAPRRSPSDAAPERGSSGAPVRAKTPAGSPRRPAPIPAVTITIASAGSSWSVTAHRGARVVVKKTAVSPGAVAALAALLNQPGVEDAVAAVNDTARGEAEARAEKLRAELAEVEAVLLSHRRP